ncbi:MAG: hypothetical protein ACK5PF_11895, partial [bacterium]
MSETLGLLESIRQAAMLRLTGATPDAVDLESRWVISDFLARSRVWRRTIALTPSAGVEDYLLGIANHESAVMLLGASYNGRELLLAPKPLVTMQDGLPTAVMLTDDRTIRIYPIPTADVTEVIEAEVALTLLPMSESAIPAVVRPYHDTVLLGVLARMYKIPDKPYTN